MDVLTEKDKPFVRDIAREVIAEYLQSLGPFIREQAHQVVTDRLVPVNQSIKNVSDSIDAKLVQHGLVCPWKHEIQRFKIQIAGVVLVCTLGGSAVGPWVVQIIKAVMM